MARRRDHEEGVQGRAPWKEGKVVIKARRVKGMVLTLTEP